MPEENVAQTRTRKTGTFHVGTSGFSYEPWRGVFYPPELKSKDMLRYYAGRFSSVEINYTFRSMPSAKSVAAWGEAVPEGFVFSFKAPMRITHMQKFGEGASETAARFLAAVAPLGPRVGPVLSQCSDTFAFDAPRVAAFLDSLPAGFRYAFEFRHPSWIAARPFLESRGASWCVAENDAAPVADDALESGPFHYLRLRTTDCPPSHLARWAERIGGALGAGRDAHCYFKHEDTGRGTKFAEELKALLR